MAHHPAPPTPEPHPKKHEKHRKTSARATPKRGETRRSRNCAWTSYQRRKSSNVSGRFRLKRTFRRGGGGGGGEKVLQRVAARFIETLHVAAGRGRGLRLKWKQLGSGSVDAARSACWRHIATPDSRSPHYTLHSAAHVSSFHNVVLSKHQRSWVLAALLFFPPRRPFVFIPEPVICNFRESCHGSRGALCPRTERHKALEGRQTASPCCRARPRDRSANPADS